MNRSLHDDNLLKKLAAAMTVNPRGTTQELAEAAGISRATFNRFCGTREKLVEMILAQAQQILQKIIDLAEHDVNDYSTAIADLIAAHLENREYLIFVCGAQNSLDNDYWESYLEALDTFFLNGQKAGVFQLDFSNQMLSEFFVATVCGMIDAGQRGRVAASGMETKMLAFFLNGAAQK
jgi:TetR/AcrR family transcriptional repressor of mexCD-oprJ operon